MAILAGLRNLQKYDTQPLIINRIKIKDLDVLFGDKIIGEPKSMKCIGLIWIVTILVLLWISAVSSQTENTPLYRWYHSDWRDHFYTTDPSGEFAPANGYNYEGITGYIATSQLSGSTPLCRWYHSDWRDHFYTTDPSGEFAPANGYNYEGITGYIWTSASSDDRDVNYSGEAASEPKNGKTWPFKLTLIGPDTDGLISGQIEWTTLDSIHQIEGSKTATGITFTETAYIKKGRAVLNCKYNLYSDGDSFTGTYGDEDSCDDGDYGTVSMKPE